MIFQTGKYLCSRQAFFFHAQDKVSASETNTRQRLGEAQRMQWLGEVAGLQESPRHIAGKNEHAERL